jgi:hypothetical protein
VEKQQHNGSSRWPESVGHWDDEITERDITAVGRAFYPARSRFERFRWWAAGKIWKLFLRVLP